MSRVYYKHLIFTFLGVLDAFINFVCAIVGYVPCVDTASTFMVYMEYKRVEKEIFARTDFRDLKGQEAEKIMADAVELLKDGKDVQNK